MGTDAYGMIGVRLLVLLLLCSGQAAGWRSRRLMQRQGYSNLLNAAQSEVKVIRQLYMGVFQDKGWAKSPDFQPLLSAAVNKDAELTAFFPSDDSWQRVADYFCLTQKDVLDNIANLPLMLANYIKSHLVPNTALLSKDFKKMTLPTLLDDPNGQAQTYLLTRAEINGTSSWLFKNASIFWNPRTRSYEDVIIIRDRTDIKAGSAVIHVTNTMFRLTDTEKFWNGQRQQVLARAGLPLDSQHCPTTGIAARDGKFSYGPDHGGSGQTPAEAAGTVMGIILGVLLVGGGILLVLAKPWETSQNTGPGSGKGTDGNGTGANKGQQVMASASKQPRKRRTVTVKGRKRLRLPATSPQRQQYQSPAMTGHDFQAALAKSPAAAGGAAGAALMSKDPEQQL